MEESKLYHAIQSNDAEDVLNLLNTEDEDVNLRNSKGETFLHTAVTSNVSPEIFKALLPKIDFSIRDANGCTVLDLITTGSYPDSAADDIKSQVREWALDGSTDKLEKMLLTGWNVWPITVEEAKEKSEELGEFVEKLGEMKTKIEEIHKAIQEGRLRDVKGLIDRKMLALAADETGLQPLQTAVVFQHPDIATFLSEEFKDALDLTDNMGRTALHYAGGSHDGGNLYQKLKDAGADDKVQDLAGKTPQEYYDDPMQLSVVEVRNRIMEIVERSEPKSAQQQTSPHSSRPTSSTEPPMTASNQHSVPIKPQKHQPVKMYIASDIYLKKNVPPPSTVDGKYVAQHMGTALTLALAEIAERRPWDPIEYLAHWLYKYRENLDHIKKQEDLLNKIRSEEAELEEEEELRSKRKEEQKQIQEEEERKRKEEEEEERKKKEQEELQRKAKEAAFAQKPHLPTVAEEGEEDTMYKDRDENGQTELHKLAAQQGVDLVALVNLGYSLADRDANNRTPRDVAEESGIQDNVEIIDSYITNMIEQEKTDSLQQLILDGYDKLNVVLEKVSTDGLPEEITEFIQSLPDFQEKISAVFKAVQSGILRDVMQAMERKKLAMAKDVYGRSPLHVAVVAEYKDIVEYILKNFPGAVKCRDSLNRTPLHYAMAVSDELADLLKENGADSEVKDVKQRTPSYYKDEKDDILQLKETLSNQGGDNSQQDEREEETEQGQQETKAEGEQSADVN